MKITLTLDNDDKNFAFVYLNAINTHFSLLNLLEEVRSMKKYGVEKTKEEIIDYVFEKLNSLTILDTKNDLII